MLLIGIAAGMQGAPSWQVESRCQRLEANGLVRATHLAVAGEIQAKL